MTGLVLVTAPISVIGLVLVTGLVPIGTFLVLIKGTGSGDWPGTGDYTGMVTSLMLVSALVLIGTVLVPVMYRYW